MRRRCAPLNALPEDGVEIQNLALLQQQTAETQREQATDTKPPRLRWHPSRRWCVWWARKFTHRPEQPLPEERVQRHREREGNRHGDLRGGRGRGPRHFALTLAARAQVEGRAVRGSRAFSPKPKARTAPWRTADGSESCLESSIRIPICGGPHHRGSCDMSQPAQCENMDRRRATFDQTGSAPAPRAARRRSAQRRP